MSLNLGARVGHDRVNPTDPDEHGPRRYKVRFDAVGRPVNEGAASGDRGVVEVEFKAREGDMEVHGALLAVLSWSPDGTQNDPADPS